MDSDDLRRAAVVAGVLGGLVSGATGDYGDAEASDSRVLPADWAFGIWFPVYAGSLAYAAETARPSRRRDPLLRRTGWPAAAAYALAGTWVRLRPRQQVPVLAATMAAAALAHARAGGGPARPTDRWTVRVPLGLFAGWLTLASVAAPTEVLLAEGVRPGPRAADAWGRGDDRRRRRDRLGGHPRHPVVAGLSGRRRVGAGGGCGAQRHAGPSGAGRDRGRCGHRGGLASHGSTVSSGHTACLRAASISPEEPQINRRIPETVARSAATSSTTAKKTCGPVRPLVSWSARQMLHAPPSRKPPKTTRTTPEVT
ncbi:hypothetical protein [Geodermatophilus sp. SYSU D00696]